MVQARPLMRQGYWIKIIATYNSRKIGTVNDRYGSSEVATKKYYWLKWIGDTAEQMTSTNTKPETMSPTLRFVEIALCAGTDEIASHKIGMSEPLLPAICQSITQKCHRAMPEELPWQELIG